MAVVNTKSASVTARDATPNTLSNPRFHSIYDGGPVDVAAADDDGSVYRVCRAHTSQRLFSVHITNAAITSGTDWDFGAYETAANGGALIDKDNIVDARTMASAVAVPTALAFTTGSDYGKRLWEILGYTSDPCKEIDLAWTANTVGSGAGTITTWVELSAL